jgi:hypothetical protein
MKSEKAIQSSIIKHFRSLDKCHVINTTVVSPIGTADLIVCYRSKFYAIEVKTQTGIESHIQKYQRSRVEAAGGVAVVVNSLDQVKALFNSII